MPYGSSLAASIRLALSSVRSAIPICLSNVHSALLRAAGVSWRRAEFIARPNASI